MKYTATKILAMISMMLMWPFISFSQNVPSSLEKNRSMHHEGPDDPYLPNAYGNKKTSPSASIRSTGFFMKQANVDANGNNIIGDAANEPSIGVDPTNLNRIVIGWRQFDNVLSNFRQAGWAYSADAGHTWTFPGKIEAGIFRSDPVLDFDSNGVCFYNSLTSDNVTYTCKVFRSTDGGASWDAGAEAFGGDKQWMTIDNSGGPGSGNIYSFWTSYYSSCQPGYFTRSINHGDSYQPCTEVIGNPYWGTMSVGNEGELYIGGAGSINGIVVSRSDGAWDPGSFVNWDMATQVEMDGYITSGADVNPVGLLGQVSIDVDRSNGPGRDNVYVVASMVRLSNNDPADIMFSRSSNGGLTWSAPVKINDDVSIQNYQWFGTMSVAPNGRIDVVWLDTRDTPLFSYLSSLYYSYSMDQGQTWSLNERLTSSFDPTVGWPQQNKMGDYFDMISDDNGAHLAWTNTLNGEEDVYYSYITPDVTGINPVKENQERLSLSAFPNPFQSHVSIRYTVGVPGKVRLEICDISGRMVKILVNEQVEPGTYTREWDSELPAGYYECTLTEANQSKHVSLVKVR